MSKIHGENRASNLAHSTFPNTRRVAVSDPSSVRPRRTAVVQREGERTSLPTVLPSSGKVVSSTPDLVQLQAKVDSLNYSIPLDVTPPVPVRSNAIQPEVARAWIGGHPPECQAAAKAIVDHTDHVSFEKFEKSLTRTMRDFDDTLRQLPSDQQDYVVLVKPGKSNKWVAELGMKHLTRLPTDVVNMDEFEEYLKTHPKAKRVLMLDDAIYSGQQMSLFSWKCMENFQDQNIKDFSIHIAAPYMTSRGEKLMKKGDEQAKEETSGLGRVHIHAHEQMKSIASVIPSEHHGMLRDMYLGGDAGDADSLDTRTLTIFDHKVADHLSTLEPVFEFGEVRNSKGRVIVDDRGRPMAVDIVPKTVAPYKSDFREFYQKRGFLVPPSKITAAKSKG